MSGGLSPVRLSDRAEIEVWTYLYNWPVESLPRITSGRFLRR